MAAYDGIADWYEREFLGRQADAPDPIGVDRALRDLLGAGEGTCLEVGCGTGVHAATVRELGRAPVGVDLSTGMLRHARGRLPTARENPVTRPSAADLVAVERERLAVSRLRRSHRPGMRGWFGN
jgi:SAM-dependent methyltransferase